MTEVEQTPLSLNADHARKLEKEQDAKRDGIREAAGKGSNSARCAEFGGRPSERGGLEGLFGAVAQAAAVGVERLEDALQVFGWAVVEG